MTGWLFKSLKEQEKGEILKAYSSNKERVRNKLNVIYGIFKVFFIKNF